MRTYHLDCGNSTFGTIGICARVAASSKQDALRKLRRAIEEALGAAGEIAVSTEQPDVEYLNVYISPENIRVQDIDEE